MASNEDFIKYVCDELNNLGSIRYRKMFGDYMVYINDKPIILICNNIIYIKMHDEIKDIMKTAEIGVPYTGAKEHYILDIDDIALCRQVITIVEPITPLPKPKKKKNAI